MVRFVIPVGVQKVDRGKEAIHIQIGSQVYIAPCVIPIRIIYWSAAIMRYSVRNKQLSHHHQEAKDIVVCAIILDIERKHVQCLELLGGECAKNCEMQ
jgi:hypothetical protein